MCNDQGQQMPVSQLETGERPIHIEANVSTRASKTIRALIHLPTGPQTPGPGTNPLHPPVVHVFITLRARPARL